MTWCTRIAATGSLAVSMTASAQVLFVPGPFPGFGEAYAAASPQGTRDVRFPAYALPAAQGTLEFWGRLIDLPDSIANSGIDFIVAVPRATFPVVDWRIGFAANDGCGGSGLHVTVGLAANGVCGGLLDASADGPTYAGFLGDASAWHHYAMTWDQAAAPGSRVAAYVDGAPIALTHVQDLAPAVFENPADHPDQFFGLLNLDERKGMVAIDNLIIRRSVKTAFDDRFSESPVGSDIVLWNRLGSPEQVRNSEVGPDGWVGAAVIPEPAAPLLMLAGLGVLAIAGRCRRARGA